MNYGYWGPDLIIAAILYAVFLGNKKSGWGIVALAMSMLCGCSALNKMLKDPMLVVVCAVAAIFYILVKTKALQRLRRRSENNNHR
ncbi:MAG: hypothetical protein Q4C83_03315 [Candidatus Saccharibacteria bacterium]|nr:hypothetical protein [Candidatus Saccharibacteria bacterium]